MDQRLLLAIVLSATVLIAYTYIFTPPTPPRSPGEKAPAQTTQQGESPSELPVEQAPAGQGSAKGTQAAPDKVPELRASTQGKKIPVRTPLFTAEFDSVGGKLISLRLNHYKANKHNINWGEVVPAASGWFSRDAMDLETGVEMVRRVRKGDDTFGVRFVGEASLTSEYQNLNYAANVDSLQFSEGSKEPAKLVLTGIGKDGLHVVKTFTFYPDLYYVDYEITVINYGTGTRSVRMSAMFGEGPTITSAASRATVGGPIWNEAGTIESEDADDIEGQMIVRDISWLGISETYFITITKPLTPISTAFYESEEVKVGDKTEWVATYGVETPVVSLQSDQQIRHGFKLYIGPKDSGLMAEFGDKLEESLNLTLEMLAQPMLSMLRWFQSYFNNWGVAIILLTLVVRIVLFPLTYKGMVNMKRMQKLQPKMKTLREKYKKDKERLNKEMMLMYKKYKMNPLGGCLPIAFQIPIFFALYSALLGAIELRHTSFIWWITDLSAMDGLYILPLLMGGSMFLQMRLSPSSPDPTQAKIMMFMPLVFTMFMFQFPSGLVLYWFTSNLLSILQQLIINRAHIPDLVDD